MPGDYACFCGHHVGSRDELIQHNVDQHGWSEHDSRTAVLQKYPEA